MPLNTLRLNHQKSSHPNDRIVFIKPLPRPPAAQAEYDLADTFLRAIAAQCLPLMKKHYLSVTTLEEYEPNREFVGRNFNNGEVVQLVLQSRSGAWLPFTMVQMVMMHELAHNSHMNHGKMFWHTRNLYAGEMKALWDIGYTGDGFWGRGQRLDEMGAVMGNNILSSEEVAALPLCGGTYRSRRRKRKAITQDLTWKEKRDRRIEKKFGKNGTSLGEDEDRRFALEINRKGPLGGKPRVAQSKRGRELRAAAALARFGSNKAEVETLEKQQRQEEDENGTETGSEDDDYGKAEDVDGDLADALDVNGNQLLDSKGGSMVPVCEDEDTDDVNVKQEMTELENLDRFFKPIRQTVTTPACVGSDDSDPQSNYFLSGRSIGHRDDYDGRKETYTKTSENDQANTNKKSSSPSESRLGARGQRVPSIDQHQPEISTTTSTSTADKVDSKTPSPLRPDIAIKSATSSLTTCPICSLENPPLNGTCLACAHVLDIQKDPRAWSCNSPACRQSQSRYLNSGDAGICGVCGHRRG
ncbi:hypothetical protein PV10_06252 [Exophiala mesophila]|uniref:WLM domain-containing protein n=1 Tax=Exophiala mesophila TaxID=212818 RepID=A0A0D1WRH6_EXOME|nr:uncharacterized protein PV10_06252 [Exophiala mesophila]KIV91745.1 hypothetical protein PV10_06252 [Exophiala mesophila]